MNYTEWSKTLWVIFFFFAFSSSYFLAVVFLLLQPGRTWRYLSEVCYLWCLVPSRTAGDAVDTLETGLNHAMEQLPFSNYGYEAINQILIEGESRVKLKDMCYLSGIVSSCILLVNLLKRISSDLYLQSAFSFDQNLFRFSMVDVDSEPI